MTLSPVDSEISFICFVLVLVIGMQASAEKDNLNGYFFRLAFSLKVDTTLLKSLAPVTHILFPPGNTFLSHADLERCIPPGFSHYNEDDPAER